MNIAKMIDHTILKADALKEDIIKYCHEAIEYGFASVCVNTCHVKTVHNLLKGSSAKTCCVIGFPLGAMSTKGKVLETQVAIEDGVEEVDMVINIGALKEENHELVYEDIKAVNEVCQANNAVLKVIIETCFLTEEEKIIACQLALRAKADFVKTSTGFGSGGATVADIRLMKKVVKDKAKIKASGGIRTAEQAQQMILAGADRIGASNGIILL